MNSLSFNRAFWATLLFASGTEGFTPSPNRAGLPSFLVQNGGFATKTTSFTRLNMSDEEKLTTITSVNKKELAFDEKSGRFFETNIDGECMPEDGEYCAVDQKTGELIRLTVQEKERIFLDALQSYYISGRQLLDDAEFDLLKEDLQWNGSDVITMNRDEAKYLAAVQAYLKGDPIMSDREFDNLKTQLKEDNSKFAVSKEPKCYIDTGICTVTLKEDVFRSNLLYLPAGALLFLGWLGFGYEIIEPIIRLNPIILIILGAYPIYTGSKFITEELVFTGKKIAYGPCPACEAENRVYFGNILGVEGFDKTAEVKCTNCKETFLVQKATLRASTLPKN